MFEHKSSFWLSKHICTMDPLDLDYYIVADPELSALYGVGIGHHKGPLQLFRI